MDKNLVLIRHPKNWGLDEGVVLDLASKALKSKGFMGGVELSIFFVGKNRAKKLNQKYRNMEYIPQVLGFPMSRKADIDGTVRLGDIVICTQKLKYEAKFQDKKLEEVLYEWLVHGIENLLK